MEPTYMVYDDIANKLKRKQRSLIPLNIVVVIISLVAAISLMFTPLITIDLTNADQIIAEFTDDQSGEESENDNSQVISAVLRSIGSQVSLTPTDIIQFALAEKNIDYIADVSADILTQSTEDLIINVGIPTITQIVFDNTGVEIPEIEEPEIILEEIKSLETATPEQTEEIINNIANEIQRQVGTDVVDEEVRQAIISAIDDAYNKTIEYNDGSFTLEACICVLASEYVDLEEFFNNVSISSNNENHTSSVTGIIRTAASSDSESETDGADTGSTETSSDDEKPIYTSYKDLVAGYLNSSSSEFVNELENILNTASPFILAFGILFIFYAVLWVILALFAFIRIFTQNKRFTMWYVKLFCFAPCLIFGIVPLVAPLIISSIGLEIAGIVSSVAGMISTMTWISGGCYVLLWLISIFWAFPIKRKIRKYNVELRNMTYTHIYGTPNQA